MWSEISITTPMWCSINSTEVPCVSRRKRNSRLSSAGFAEVQTGRRLVETEQQRIGAHRPRDLEPSLRAIGQVTRGIVGAFDEPYLLQPIGGPVQRLLFAAPVRRQA